MPEVAVSRSTQDEPETTGDARSLHGDALVWDMTLPFGQDCADFDKLLPRYKAAGVDFVSLTVNQFSHPLADTLLHMAELRTEIRSRANQYVFVKSVDEILEAKKDGRLALGFHFQETNPLEGSLHMVETFYDLGVRHMLLAYNQKNRVGDGCAERTDAGLSRFGISVVKEMNRVGMLVDGSHSGYRTTMDAMEVSTAPFIFSHANAYSLYPHYRNIRDDQTFPLSRECRLVAFRAAPCGLSFPRIKGMTGSDGSNARLALMFPPRQRGGPPPWPAQTSFLGTRPSQLLVNTRVSSS